MQDPDLNPKQSEKSDTDPKKPFGSPTLFWIISIYSYTVSQKKENIGIVLFHK
jgi:hypothetical protein